MNNISKFEFENLTDFDFHIEIDDGMKTAFYETAKIDFKCFDKKNNTRVYMYLFNTDSLFSAVKVATIKDIFIKEYEFVYNYRLLRQDFEKLLAIKAKCLSNNNEDFYKEFVNIVNNAIEKSKIRKTTYPNRYIFPRNCGNNSTFFLRENRIGIGKNGENKIFLNDIETGSIIKQTYGGKCILGIYDICKNNLQRYVNSDGNESDIAFPTCIIISEDNLRDEEYLESFKPDTNYANSAVIIKKEDLTPDELDLYNKIHKKFSF